MQAIDVILLNFRETRKKSLQIFNAIPSEHIHWKPDESALSLIQIVRHIYECDDWFTQIILHQLKAEEHATDFDSKPYFSIAHEIETGQHYQETFWNLIASFSNDDLDRIQLTRPKWQKSLGEFLVRETYHEAYHAGQLQLYLRLLKVPRPDIW